MPRIICVYCNHELSDGIGHDILCPKRAVNELTELKAKSNEHKNTCECTGNYTQHNHGGFAVCSYCGKAISSKEIEKEFFFPPEEVKRIEGAINKGNHKPEGGIGSRVADRLLVLTVESSIVNVAHFDMVNINGRLFKAI